MPGSAFGPRRDIHLSHKQEGRQWIIGVLPCSVACHQSMMMPLVTVRTCVTRREATAGVQTGDGCDNDECERYSDNLSHVFLIAVLCLRRQFAHEHRTGENTATLLNPPRFTHLSPKSKKAGALPQIAMSSHWACRAVDWSVKPPDNPQVFRKYPDASPRPARDQSRRRD